MAAALALGDVQAADTSAFRFTVCWAGKVVVARRLCADSGDDIVWGPARRAATEAIALNGGRPGRPRPGNACCRERRTGTSVEMFSLVGARAAIPPRVGIDRPRPAAGYARERTTSDAAQHSL